MPFISAGELSQLRTAQKRLDEIAPVLGLVTAATTEFNRATGEGAGPDAAMAVAETAIREQLTDRYASEIRIERGHEIRREIEERDGEELRAQAARDFATNEEPGLRETLTREVESSITRNERARLRRERPEEIKAEIEAERGDEIRSAEQERFAREEEQRVREQAARDAERKLRDGERRRLHDEVTTKVRAEKFATVEQEERRKAELTQRLRAIQEGAKASHRIPFELLRTDDVLVIELGARHTTFDRNTSQEEPQRILRLSVRDEETGAMMVLDDSWQKGSPLERAACLDDGTIVVISTAIKNQGESEEHTESAHAITRGVALRMQAAGEQEQPEVTEGYEVSKVWYAPEDDKQLLLGPDQSPQFRGYRY